MLGLHGCSWPDLPHVQRHQDQAGVLHDGDWWEEGVSQHSPDVGRREHTGLSRVNCLQIFILVCIAIKNTTWFAEKLEIAVPNILYLALLQHDFVNDIYWYPTFKLLFLISLLQHNFVNDRWYSTCAASLHYPSAWGKTGTQGQGGIKHQEQLQTQQLVEFIAIFKLSNLYVTVV